MKKVYVLTLTGPNGEFFETEPSPDSREVYRKLSDLFPNYEKLDPDYWCRILHSTGYADDYDFPTAKAEKARAHTIRAFIRALESSK